jgi:Ca2+-binding RTX toxin-like protein
VEPEVGGSSPPSCTNSGANVIDGGGNIDTIDGGGGADTLVGGSGDDRLFVDVAGDTIVELLGLAGGNDTVLSATLSLDLTLSRYASVENATLSGARDLKLAEGNTLLASVRLIGVDIRSNRAIEELSRPRVDGGYFPANRTFSPLRGGSTVVLFET